MVVRRLIVDDDSNATIPHLLNNWPQFHTVHVVQLIKFVWKILAGHGYRFEIFSSTAWNGPGARIALATVSCHVTILRWSGRSLLQMLKLLIYVFHLVSGPEYKCHMQFSCSRDLDKVFGVPGSASPISLCPISSSIGPMPGKGADFWRWRVHSLEITETNLCSHIIIASTIPRMSDAHAPSTAGPVLLPTWQACHHNR